MNMVEMRVYVYELLVHCTAQNSFNSIIDWPCVLKKKKKEKNYGKGKPFIFFFYI